ncbi:MAG TPA: MFS transporter [Gammaproteobacteria bacterium]|nr:MFS transporter [Gammaproteobacteria bacterium]
MIHPVWHRVHERQVLGEADRPIAVVGLLGMAFASFMMGSDVTTLGIILPKVQESFATSVSTAQWVMNAYALVFGILIVAGGRLADIFGRRRMLIAGTAIFAAAAMVAGAAPGVFWLIGARALMGAGGAMMWPAALAISYTLVPKSKAALAGGVILGALGLGGSSGPLIAGALSEFASWRWVLFVNVPAAAVVLAIACFGLRLARTSGSGERIDYAGISVLAALLLALLLAFDQAADWGLRDPRILGLLGAAALLLLAFFFIERRAGDAALVPGALLRRRDLAASLASRFFIGGNYFVALVYLPEFMEKVLGYPPLAAGVGMIPMMLGFALTSFAAGPLYPRWGAKYLCAVGMGVVVVGIALLMRLDAHSGYGVVLPGLLLVGVGYGLGSIALNTASVLAVPPAHASLAGAMLYMAQLVGGSLGLGAYTLIFSASAIHSLNAAGAAAGFASDQLAAASRLLLGAGSGNSLLARFGASADALHALARDSFVVGLQTGFLLLLALGALSALTALLFLGNWRLPRAAPGVESLARD